MSKDKPSKKPVSQEPPAAETERTPAPPRPKIVARKCYGMEDVGRLDRMRKELFEADAARFQDRKKAGYGEWKDMLTAALGYWVSYPLFLEFVGHDWHADGTRTAAYYALNHAHTEATHVLMEEAGKHGLDPHPLYECGRVVQEIYADAPEKYYAGRYDTWPECMGTARYSLPQGQQDALRAGEAVLIRLAVKAGVTDKKGMGEIARKVTPAMPPADSAMEKRCPPMSRAEIARRLLGKSTARTRDASGMMERHGLRKEQDKPALYTICIDKLDPMTKDRLLKPVK
jgi:hypothetical protein